MPKLIFENFIGQAPPTLNESTILNVGPKDSYASATVVDPISRPGILCPGFGGVDLTNVSEVDNLIRRFQLVDSATPKIYGLEDRTGGSDSNIQEITLSTNTITTPVFHTIAAAGAHAGHTVFTGEDMVPFQINSVDYFVYSWNDTTDGDLGRFTVAGGTPDDDYLTDVATSGAALGVNPHPLIEGDNGFLYIADGNSIHKLDGSTANGTFTASVIDLPAQFIIKDWVSWKGFLFILAHRRLSTQQATESHKREVKVFIWNYISVQAGNETGFEAIVPLDDDTFAAKIVIYKGIPYVFTVGGGSRTRLSKWNGANFDIVYEFDGRLSYPNVIGGTEQFLQHLIWGTVDGRLKSFGSIGSGFPELPNDIMHVDSEAGAIIRTIDAGVYYISDRSNSTYTIKKTGGFNTFGTLHSLFKELPYMSRLTRITFLYPKFTSTTNSDLTFIVEKNLVEAAVPVEREIVHSVDASRGWFSVPLDMKNTHAVKVRMTWTLSAADATASNAIKPYRVEIDYEPTTKKF